MRLPFVKMQGAGNDFVVLDATRGVLELDAVSFRRLADRHFGIGADQILIVGPSPQEGVDFSYRIINADGSEVEQCGNGARCFMRFVRERGLTHKDVVKVRTLSGDIVLRMNADRSVTVDMGAPVFELERIPFCPGCFPVDGGIKAVEQGLWQVWPLPLVAGKEGGAAKVLPDVVACAVVSMGNPHAVIRVDDVDAAPVSVWGPLIEGHVCFPKRVNVGFLEVMDAGHARVRVFERGTGETLACGTGVCAAVVCGVRMGWLNESVDVDARGGRLGVRWAGMSRGLSEPVWMSGPAEVVFEGVIEL